MKHYGFWKISALLLFYLIAQSVFAATYQEQATGRIKGVLTDPTGALISDASIMIKNAALGKERELKSNEEGVFGLDLPPGTYEIKIKSYGFKTVHIKELELKANSVETLKLNLSIDKAVFGPHPIGSRDARIEPLHAPVNQTINKRKIP